MIIKDVVTLAKFSEVAGISIKTNTEAIVAFINLGMLELYKRFSVRVKEHVVDLEPAVVYYTMPSDFMVAIEAYGEIPEKSDLKYNSLSIGNQEDPDSIYFTDWKTIQVPSSIKGSSIAIIYVSKPTSISVADAEDGVTDLDLPDVLVEALLSYIGYRAYLGVKSDGQSENNAHWARFERSCKKASDLGVGTPNESMSMYERLSIRGFV